ncbi:hypothetical protein HYE68_003008 [Fusarium pseudograminearum]|nr:hypothetical protein HYE68_003008 [Fusarium pseudograminearum]
MTPELPDHGLTSVVSDTKPPSDTSTNLDPSAERSNTADLQDNTLCSRCKRNVPQTPDDQSDTNECSSSLEHSSQQLGDRTDQDTRSDAQSVRSMTGSGSYSDGSDVYFEREPHWSEIVGPGRLSPRVEGKFLQLIKKKMLFLWGVGTEDVPNISIDTHGLKTLRFKTENHAVISLAWDEHSRTPTYRKEVARAQSSICQAWPRDRNVFGVEQFVLASNGRDQATTISLKYFEQSYMDEVVAFKSPSILHAGYEDIWHRWCFGADEILAIKESKIPIRGKIVYCTSSSQSKGFRHLPLTAFAVAVSDDEPFSVADQERHNFNLRLSYFSANFRGGCVISPWPASIVSIHWQVRYFEPTSGPTQHDAEINTYVLSERQNATIRQGPTEIHVQENRAQIVFRVLYGNENLFHIMVLSDNTLTSDHINSPAGTQSYLSRYGLKIERRNVPITHYLLEVCKAFDRSVQGWVKTLDSIDDLVHVNLSDFDDRERIEDLMFDKSFNRSRDYFVALQLLRIMDEWINEAISSIQQLRDDTHFMYPSLYIFDIKDNLDAVDRYMKEKAGTVAERAISKGPDSLLFIHYSGHGARLRTQYSEKKKGTYDEALCFLDFKWRDVEVSDLLDSFTKRKLAVLVVLDCCHSGGADRLDDNLGAVRSLDHENQENFQDEPQESNFIDPGSDSSSYTPPENGDERNAIMQKGWFYKKRDHNLIAACQPYEKARECTDDNGEAIGTLTYYLRQSLDTFHKSEDPITYGKLIDDTKSLCQKARGDKNTLQQPMHLGNRQRLLFGVGTDDGLARGLQAYVTGIQSVLGVDNVIFNKGASHGVEKGDVFLLYPRNQVICGSITSGARHSAEVQVTYVEGVKSRAKVISVPDGTNPQPAIGWFADRKQHRPSLVSLDEKLGDGPIDWLLQKWSSISWDSSSPLVELRPSAKIGATEQKHVLLTLTNSSHGTRLRFLDSKKKLMNHVPIVSWDEQDVAQKLRYLLPTLCSYQRVVDLGSEKPADQNPKFFFHAKRVTGAMPSTGEERPIDEAPVVKGPTCKITFENKSGRTLYVTVFNLGQAYGIYQVVPSEGADSLEVPDGESIPFTQLQICLPELLNNAMDMPGFQMVDIFKAVVTLRSTNFSSYVQSDLEGWEHNSYQHGFQRNTTPAVHKLTDFWTASDSIITSGGELIRAGDGEVSAPGAGVPDDEGIIEDGHGNSSGSANPSGEPTFSTIMSFRPSNWGSS